MIAVPVIGLIVSTYLGRPKGSMDYFGSLFKVISSECLLRGAWKGASALRLAATQSFRQ
jgi:hypothetical protein